MEGVPVIPIIISAAASVLIGWIWYHPRVFGTAWMRMSGITPDVAERGKRRMPMTVATAFIANMVIAWVMFNVGLALGIYDLVGAVVDLALWLWLGFVATTMLGSVLWDQKPVSLYLINAGYWLVSFAATAVILFQ